MLRDCACGAHAPRRLTRLSAAVHLAESMAHEKPCKIDALHTQSRFDRSVGEASPLSSVAGSLAIGMSPSA